MNTSSPQPSPPEEERGKILRAAIYEMSPNKLNPWFLLWSAATMLLVTGCPHNEYIVELRPRGHLMERKLVFYCEDGKDTNGLPNYETFPRDELATIARLYPPGAIMRQGERRTAVGEFGGTMPSDIGGA